MKLEFSSLSKQLINYISIMEPKTNQSTQDAEFQKKLKQAMYKTTAKDYGGLKPKIQVQPGNGINGKFTDHLIYSGMYRNASLNTTADRDRWLNGSKDWMEHLG